jgi:prepilin-type N-terminal cleavage/methylation domain-containing protein
MKRIKETGFTLIELVVVIVILGILAATAAPKFMNLQRDARISALNGLAGNIESAIDLASAKALVQGVSPIPKQPNAAYIQYVCVTDNCPTDITLDEWNYGANGYLRFDHGRFNSFRKEAWELILDFDDFEMIQTSWGPPGGVHSCFFIKGQVNQQHCDWPDDAANIGSSCFLMVKEGTPVGYEVHLYTQGC